MEKQRPDLARHAHGWRGLGSSRFRTKRVAKGFIYNVNFLCVEEKKTALPVCDPQPLFESYYGSPPRLFLNEMAGLETSSRPCLLKFDAPCHRHVTVQPSFAQKENA